LPTDNADTICRQLADVFSSHGESLYVVGGSVRDAILGRETKDIDLATSATPDEIKRLLAAAEPDSIYDVGEKYGTIGAIFGDGDDALRFEITTFRSEKYTPRSRRPEVRFGTSIEGDLSRRDFTMNALARDIRTGRIIDPFGGLDDIARRTIRAVGNPDERFAEDPLRLLRAVRFASELQFQIEPRTRAAIARDAPGLADISRERILEEINRILLSPVPSVGLRLLVDLNLAQQVLPEVVALRTTSQGRRSKDVLAHTLMVVDRSPRDLVSRWSALLHDIGKPATLVTDGDDVAFPGHDAVGERLARDILTRLRLDVRSTERITKLVGLHMRANQYEDEWTDGAVRRLMREAGEDLPLLLGLSLADVTSYREAKQRAAAARVRRLKARADAIAEQENVQAIKSPLDGNDLMELFGGKPGPWIGRIKDHLLGLVLEGSLHQNDRERAVEIARELVAGGETGAVGGANSS